MADTITDIKALTSAVEKLTAKVDKLGASFKNATAKAQKGMQGVAAANALYGGGGGSGFGGSGLGLGSFSSAFSYGAENRMAGLGKGGLTLGLGIASAGYSAAPDLGMQLTRASGYYGAARMGSNMARATLQSRTLSALNGGISGIGDDAAAAGMLVNGYNYNPGSVAYMQTMREVGGAAKYMNMSNATAAQALGGLQTGSMGGNLYQYGIQTYDANKNRPKTTAEIFSQIYGKIWGGGKKETVEGVRMSLQRGLAGANIRNMGLDQAQQELFNQYAIDRVQGKNPDLAQAGNLASQQGRAGNANPITDIYRTNSSTTGLYQKSEEAYLSGFHKAADTVVAFNSALSNVIEPLGQLKGLLQGLGGSNLGGAIAGMGTAATGAMAMLGGAMGAKGAGAVAKGGMRLLGKGLGAGAAIAGGTAIKNGSKEGSFQSRFGKAVQYGGTGLFVGGAFDPLGWGLGLAGAAYGFATGGGEPGYGGDFGGHAGGPANSTFAFSSPIPGAGTTATYGEKGNLWKSGKHTGLDFKAKLGDPVKAIGDGVVIKASFDNSYGRHIVIKHANGYTSLYGHLDSMGVGVNANVTKGQVIGKAGETGNATGPHLHLEVRSPGGGLVDPAAFLKGKAGSASSSNGGAGRSASSSVASAVLGGGDSGIDLSAGYSAANSLFNSSIGSTLNSANPTGSQKDEGTPAGMILGTGDQKSWARKLLGRLGAPTSDTNIKAMTTWMAWEGGHWKNSATYNPLNTTQPESGAKSMNSHGVKAYKNWEQGLEATITTLHNGRYTNILSALQKGSDSQAVVSAINSSPWGTHIKGAAGGGTPGYGAHISGAVGGGAGGSMFSGGTTRGGSGGSINIQVYPQGASDADALIFAKKVKRYLDSDREIGLLGGN